jgi:hypothetical protein
MMVKKLSGHREMMMMMMMQAPTEGIRGALN